MKLRIVTIGKPKLVYAKFGFDEYLTRLQRLHDVTVTHIPDRQNDAKTILETTKDTARVALVIDAKQFSSHELATFLQKRELEAKEVSFLIGGPDGLPAEVIKKSDYQLSLSKLTLPHDLAMVTLAETFYRSSTINTRHPYHH